MLAELEVLLLAGIVGAMCGLCNAFPNIVVNCCFQLPKSQSVGCATTNSCAGVLVLQELAQPVNGIELFGYKRGHQQGHSPCQLYARQKIGKCAPLQTGEGLSEAA